MSLSDATWTAQNLANRAAQEGDERTASLAKAIAELAHSLDAEVRDIKNTLRQLEFAVGQIKGR